VELTSTRYLLGPAAFAEALNQELEPQLRRFRNVLCFNIAPKPGIETPRKLDELTAVVATNGQYAVIEFGGALPRAGLYSRWIVQTNDVQTLETLASPASVLRKRCWSRRIYRSPPPALRTKTRGTVSFVSYTPRTWCSRRTLRNPRCCS